MNRHGGLDSESDIRRPVITALLAQLSMVVACGSTADVRPAAELKPGLEAIVEAEARRGFSGAVLVARGQQVLLDRGVGEIQGVAMTADTRFWIASAGKQFTSAAVLRCSELGLLSLDAPLSSVFPDAPGEKRSMTIRQLLSYTSGLAPSDAGETAASAQQAIDEVLVAPTAAPPGERFIYSTANYTLAAAIVERVSGTPFPDFVRREIFDKAGLRDTGQAVGAAAGGVAPLRGELPERLRNRSWNALGYYSSTRDIARWMAALQGQAILSSASVQALFSPVAPIREGHAALGWFQGVTPGGTRHIFTRGNEDMGANASIYFYPADRTLIVVLTHAGDESADLSWSRFVHRRLEAALGLS